MAVAAQGHAPMGLVAGVRQVAVDFEPEYRLLRAQMQNQLAE
jgi:hypothetical protein